MTTFMFSAILFIGLPGDAKPAAGDSPFARTSIDMGMVVSDLDRSVKFYQDDLGMLPATPPTFDVPGDLTGAAGLTDGKAVHVVVLVLGEGESASHLKLIEFRSAKKGDTAFIESALGVRYLTFIVKDLTAVLDRLKARSIPVLGKGPVSLPGGAGIAVVRDPDGNFVEFVGSLAAPARTGFVPLFDGKGLQGWKTLRGGSWKVADGAIVGEQGPGNAGGWLVTEKAYGDFELKFKFRMSKGANSGVAFRFPADTANPSKGGYECQLSEADPNYQTGSIFGLVKAPAGIGREEVWSEGRIVAKGPEMITFIDGKEAARATDTRSARGLIGLQVHATPKYAGMKVEFRDIEIREE